ncbi:MAG TPA: CBS domain-containing protein [Actinomycetota bacterium]
MTRTIREVMTGNPRTISAGAPVTDAARAMRDADVGAVIVLDDGKVGGIVTDRDITIRSTAFGYDPSSTPVRQVCSTDVTTLSPDDDLREAVLLMRSKNVRRLPVVDGNQPVGMVSLGDLAIERDPESALSDISVAPPNQ